MLHYIRACIIGLAEIIIGITATIGMIAIGIVGTMSWSLLFRWSGIGYIWATFYEQLVDLWETLLENSKDAFIKD